MSIFDRPTHPSGRERSWGNPGRRRAPRNPRWEDDDRFFRASSEPERDPYFGYEGEEGRVPFEPRDDFSRAFREQGPERDFAGSFGDRDPAAWRRGGGPFEQHRSRRFASENRDAWGPGRGFEPFEDWQRPRRFEPGMGVYGGTPQRDAELRGAYPSQRPRGGPYAGLGPKDFRRSDERLREEICEQLMADPDIDASELTVTVRDAEVILEGSVEDRQMKRDAEDCAESVLGVRQVHNRLRVGSGAADTAGSRPFEARGQQAAPPEGQRAGRSAGKPV
jgi:hypothetical protein